MAIVDPGMDSGASKILASLSVYGSPNGGSGGGTVSKEEMVYPGGTISVSLSGIPRPSRSGYNFRGWSTSSSGSVVYSSSATYSVTVPNNGQEEWYAAKTIYAVWSRTSTLNYSGNAPSGSTVSNVPSSQTYIQGTTAAISTTIPVCTGYAFKGWNTKADGTGTTYQPGANVKFSTAGSWYLYAIWKQIGSLTASDATMGVSHSVTINNSDSSSTFTVAYSVAGQSGWVSGPSASSNKNLTWTPSTDLANYITNATSAQMTLTLYTYSGSSLVGSATKTVKLYVPDSMVPTISSFEMNELTEMPSEFEGVWVREVSRPQFSITASGVSGSTISLYSVTIGGVTFNSSSSDVNIGILDVYGQSLSATITVKDTRGRTASSSHTFTAYDHFMPSVVSADAYRDATPSEIIVNYSFAIAPVNNLNHKTIRIGYKTRDSQYYDHVPDITPDLYSGDGSYTITDTNLGQIYDIAVQVIDSVGNSEEYYIEVARYGGFYFDVNPDDDTIAYHGEAPGDGADHYYEKILAIEQGHSAKSVSSSGTSYVRIAKLLSKVKRSPNLSKKSTISSSFTIIDANSSSYLGPLFDNLSAGTYTMSWKYKIEAIPDGVSKLTMACQLIYVDSNSSNHYIGVTHSGETTLTDFSLNGEYDYDATFTLTSDILSSAQSYILYMYCMTDVSTPYSSRLFTVSVKDFQLESGSTPTEFVPYVDMNNRNMTAPIFLRYMNSELDAPIKLTIQFDGAMNKTKFYIAFTNMGEADLVQISDEQWDLYVKKSSSSDIIDVLDVINPPRNKDLLIDWDNTVLSSLPTGYVAAGNDPYEIGHFVYVDASVVNVANNSWKTIATITLPSRGMWLVYLSAQFASNATGRRMMIFTKTQNSDSGNLSVQFKDNRAPANGSVSLCKGMDVRRITSPETIYLNVYQNSGSALDCYGRIYAIRLN